MTTPNFDTPEGGLHFVYDVESIGLFGVGFAVGYVVFREGKPGWEAEGLYACPSDAAGGFEEDREWVEENVPDISPTHDTPEEIREAFWQDMRRWKFRGAEIWADSIWPVDTGFMTSCVRDDLPTRTWKGPHPIWDIRTLGKASGVSRPRLQESDLRHHPLGDAKRSAKYLRAILASLD